MFFYAATIKKKKTESSCLPLDTTSVLFLESSPKEATTTEEEGERCEVLEAQVLCLSGVVRDNSAEFIRHVHGSHVVRTLLHVLAGCLGPPRTEARSGTRRSSSSSGLPTGRAVLWQTLEMEFY